MTTEIFLIRHGQTRSNVTGYTMGRSEEDLNETGYMQASKLAMRLMGLPIAAIYASPLQRAGTTASLIAKPHGIKAVPLDDLTEMNLGDWQGLHITEIAARWPELWAQSRRDLSVMIMPNGESFDQVIERAVRAFEKVAAAHKDSVVAIVTHEIIVKILVAHVTGVAYSIYRRIKVENASLSEVRVADNLRRLILLNDTSHFEIVPSSLP